MSAPAEIKPAFFDKRGLAFELSCSPRWIEARVEDGMPHHFGAGKLKFELEECLEWLIEHGHWERRA